MLLYVLCILLAGCMPINKHEVKTEYRPEQILSASQVEIICNLKPENSTEGYTTELWIQKLSQINKTGTGPKLTIKVDKSTIITMPSHNCISFHTKVTCLLHSTNVRTEVEVKGTQNIQLSVTHAIEQIAEHIAHAISKNLYKDYGVDKLVMNNITNSGGQNLTNTSTNYNVPYPTNVPVSRQTPMYKIPPSSRNQMANKDNNYITLQSPEKVLNTISKGIDVANKDLKIAEEGFRKADKFMDQTVRFAENIQDEAKDVSNEISKLTSNNRSPVQPIPIINTAPPTKPDNIGDAGTNLLDSGTLVTNTAKDITQTSPQIKNTPFDTAQPTNLLSTGSDKPVSNFTNSTSEVLVGDKPSQSAFKAVNAAPEVLVTAKPDVSSSKFNTMPVAPTVDNMPMDKNNQLITKRDMPPDNRDMSPGDNQSSGSDSENLVGNNTKESIPNVSDTKESFSNANSDPDAPMSIQSSTPKRYESLVTP